MNQRKAQIGLSLNLPFASIIIKYDYYLRCKKDFILNKMKQRDPKGGRHFLAVMKDGRVVVYRSGIHNLLVYNVKTQTVDITLEGITEDVESLVVLNDNRIVAGCGQLLIIWNVLSSQPESILRGHNPDSFIRRIFVLPDNRIITSEEGVDDPQIMIWNPDTGDCDLTITKNCDGTDQIMFINNMIISSCGDKKIRIWNLEGTLKVTLEGHTDRITDIKILTPNRIISSSVDGTIRTWNINEYSLKFGSCEFTLYGHMGPIYHLAVIKDKIIGSFTNGIRVWKNGQIEMDLEGHIDLITQLKVLPNNWLASASVDSTIRIWNLVTEQYVCTLRGHEGTIAQLEVLKDGRLISAGDENDRFTIVWD